MTKRDNQTGMFEHLEIIFAKMTKTFRYKIETIIHSRNPMFRSIINRLIPAPIAHAHCDGPCGVYDPSSARIAAEAVRSMTKKLIGLEVPSPSDKDAYVKYHNTYARFVAVKEQQAHLAKEELLVLWTDFFKPHHLEANPEIHNIFWKAAKLCSACKVEVSAVHAQELMDAIKEIHEIFWAIKGRDVPWYTAS
jgi:nickel superoxide dismutase